MVTIGSIQGGVRGNIIPDSVVMLGTVRTFDSAQRRDIRERVIRTAQLIAQSGGATADVNVELRYPVTVNDPALTAKMLPSLRRVVGDTGVSESPLVTGAEDFSFYGKRAPALYVHSGRHAAGFQLAHRRTESLPEVLRRRARVPDGHAHPGAPGSRFSRNGSRRRRHGHGQRALTGRPAALGLSPERR